MNGDILNKILLNRLEVKDKKTGDKRYHIRGVQRLNSTMISVVLYNRIGKNKTKVMELQDFIKNFDEAAPLTQKDEFNKLLKIPDILSRNSQIVHFLKKYCDDVVHEGNPDAADRYKHTTYIFKDESSVTFKDSNIQWKYEAA